MGPQVPFHICSTLEACSFLGAESHSMWPRIEEWGSMAVLLFHGSIEYPKTHHGHFKMSVSSSFLETPQAGSSLENQQPLYVNKAEHAVLSVCWAE